MLAQASMGAPAKGSWGSYQAWWAEGNGKQGSGLTRCWRSPIKWASRCFPMGKQPVT